MNPIYFPFFSIAYHSSNDIVYMRKYQRLVDKYLDWEGFYTVVIKELESIDILNVNSLINYIICCQYF